MHDLPRVSFLLVTNALLVAMLVMVLGGCGATPTRYRHGDFIMNIGSAPPTVAATPKASATVSVAATALASERDASRA